MRTVLIGLGAVLGFSLFAPTASAQDTGFSDPFFLYYGFFLPRQSALAAQGQPEDFYRNQSIQRQAMATTDRAGLYDVSTIGLDELDPMRAFGTRSGATRMVGTTPIGLRSSVTKVGHSAPHAYFARTAGGSQGHAYFPTMRTGLNARSRAPLVTAPSARGNAPSAMPQLPGTGMIR